MQWQREGTSAEALKADTLECQKIARIQAHQVGFRRSLFWPGMWHRYGYYGYSPLFYDDYYDTFYIEQDLRDSCLTAKGYRLVPAPQAQAQAGQPPAEPAEPQP
jgi:hypothetical protein